MNLFHIAFPAHPDGEREVKSGFSKELEEECGLGFIFSGFGENAPIYTIPPYNPHLTEEETVRWCAENDALFADRQFFSVDKATHLRLVETAVDFVKQIEAASGKHSKVVAARTKVVDSPKNVMEIFHSLVEAYPDACVFLFSTSVSGTWIGASPELLCSIINPHAAEGRYEDKEVWHFNTVSLAGTRPAGTQEPWDEKNIIEQAMVTDFIISTLQSLGIEAVKESTTTRRAGKIEHILTPIHAVLPDSYRRICSQPPVESIISALSPTPALCGHPRHETMDFLIRNESFDRDFYGGFIGFITPASAEVFVNLRSGRCLPGGKGLLLYAGGGITADSIPEREWEETERKISTIMSVL